MSYHDLKSYQQATIIFDFTEEFCGLYLQEPYYLRRRSQMIEAARSGKSNIAEGSKFSRTSSKLEIKLLGSSRASLEELLEDYKDFLRQRGMKLWDKDSGVAMQIRQLQDRIYGSYRTYMGNRETAANVMVCLINQTNYLLDRQINALEKKFLAGGGYTENLYKKRRDARGY